MFCFHDLFHVADNIRMAVRYIMGFLDIAVQIEQLYFQIAFADVLPYPLPLTQANCLLPSALRKFPIQIWMFFLIGLVFQQIRQITDSIPARGRS